MHNIDRVFVWTLEVELNELNKHETIDNAKVPLALVTLYKTIDYGCA
jgi:hypothetical protein